MLSTGFRLFLVYFCCFSLFWNCVWLSLGWSYPHIFRCICGQAVFYPHFGKLSQHFSFVNVFLPYFCIIRQDKSRILWIMFEYIFWLLSFIFEAMLITFEKTALVKRTVLFTFYTVFTGTSPTSQRWDYGCKVVLKSNCCWRNWWSLPRGLTPTPTCQY